MVILGKNLIIKTGGVAIAAARSCDVTVTAEQIPVSSPMNGQWEYSYNGKKSWSVNTNQLMLGIACPISMVGSTVSLSVEIPGEQGIAFSGFRNPSSVEEGTLEQDEDFGIYWDPVRKKFLAADLLIPSGFIYYESWVGGNAFMTPQNYDMFNYNGVTYTYYNGELMSEKLTGNANVVTWRGVGITGNLAQGSFDFNGNGPLTPLAITVPQT